MKEAWYRACGEAAEVFAGSVPPAYRSRTFAGIIGDIKALPPGKASSLVGRKKGLGARYAQLYLSEGVDGGKGYQACACEALAAVLGGSPSPVVRVPVLDAGCAVGVTAGVLGLDGVFGFDLFPDLLWAARLADGIAGKRNRYAAADMTRPWPFREASFATVVCGLVCHHLKDQKSLLPFFESASRVLAPGGSLVVTLPAGSVSRAEQLGRVTEAVEGFGFARRERFCGMAVSVDDPRSLFWMFLLVFEKTGERQPGVFLHPGFGFPEIRTPETREEKGEKVRVSAGKARLVRHGEFRFLDLDGLTEAAGESPLVYETVRGIAERAGGKSVHSIERTDVTGL